MSWRTSRPVLLARKLGRSLGINRVVARIILGSEYEANYDRQFATRLRPGDCVWDVGANVGHYTKLFSERVGPHGRVYAFEPSPRNFERLQESCGGLANSTLFNMGLGHEDATLGFEQGADDLGATSRVVDVSEAEMQIPVRSGSSLLAEGLVEQPNVIKIDVEGFEPEVIAGLGDRLKDEGLRSIGIEVHFRILAERGLSGAPAELEKILREHGFEVSWADPSHLLAVRSSDAVDHD